MSRSADGRPGQRCPNCRLLRVDRFGGLVKACFALTGGVDRRRVLALGEAKWRTVPGVAELERLIHAGALLQTRADLDASTAGLLLFSGSGFTPELSRRAGPDVVLVDMHRLYHGD